MANIRIDNASDDVLKIELDGEEYFIPEDESITVSSVEKGMHKLIVCRTKRTEIGTDVHSDEENPTQKFSRDEKSQYVRLKGSYEIDVIVFPNGFGILIFTVLVFVALMANISGNPIMLGGRSFTYPWTFGLMAIDLGFIGYFTVMLINIFSTDKRYR